MIAFGGTERESRVEAMGVFQPSTSPKSRPWLWPHLQELTSPVRSRPMKEVSDLKNRVKGKAAGYDGTIGLFEAFRRWQGYHDVGLSMSLHLIVVTPEG